MFLSRIEMCGVTYPSRDKDTNIGDDGSGQRIEKRVGCNRIHAWEKPHWYWKRPP